jgi:hypothetical protein
MGDKIMASVKDKKVANFRTICEVHREIYDIIVDENIDTRTKRKLIKLIDEAYIMAKKMNGKLHQYKENYDDGWWEEQKAEIIKDKLSKGYKLNKMGYGNKEN